MKLRTFRLRLVFVSLLIAGPLAAEELWQPVGSLDDLARNYVLLVLRMDKHIAGFNDYYYGPPEWKQRVDAEEKVPVGELRRETQALLAALKQTVGRAERRRWFRQQLIALDTNLRKLEGEKIPVAEQARLLFDLRVTPPTVQELDDALAELERLLPCFGPLAARGDALGGAFLLRVG